MKNTSGFSLLEMTFAVAILAIVSALSFVALQGSTETTSLTQAKAEVQSNLREIMTAITSEARTAYTEKSLEDMDPQFVPEEAVAISIGNDGRSLSFTVPEATGDSRFITASSLITYRYENEDGLNDAPVNGILDEGEDVNEDGLLNRRLLREQDGEIRVVGGVNDISDIVFELRPNASDNDLLTTLYIRVESSKGYGANLKHQVRGQTETTLHLQN